jgi:hypothetical protein
MTFHYAEEKLMVLRTAGNVTHISVHKTGEIIHIVVAY